MSYVRLHGGPRDGTIVSWAGGDIINMAPEVGVSPTPVRGGSVQVGTVEPEMYRRSLRSADVFVWQP